MYTAPLVKPLCPPKRPPRFADVPFAEVTLDDGTAHTLRLDIYQNPNQKDSGPCIIYYFGGGWMWGEYKQVTQKAVYCRDLVELVEQGYTIVSPSYRLASQAAFPACIYDCKAVVRFLRANAETYHIAPDRIGVLGNSAGGHLAAMVAMSADCKEMEGDVGGNLEYSSAVKAAVILYAPVDILDGISTNASKLDGPPKDLTGTEIDNAPSPDISVETHILGYTGHDKSLWSLNQLLESGDTRNPDWKYIQLAEQCSPVRYASANCPPMIILHGSRDPVVSIGQSEKLYKALAESGADVTYIAYSGGGHGPSLGSEIDRIAYSFLTDRL